MSSTAPSGVVAKTLEEWLPHLTHTLRVGAIDPETPAHTLAYSIFLLMRAHFGHLKDYDRNNMTPEDIVQTVWGPLVDLASEHPDIQPKLARFIPQLLADVQNHDQEAERRQLMKLEWHIVKNSREYSKPQDGDPAQKRASWVNFCRFAALLQKEETGVELHEVFTEASKGILWGEAGPTHDEDAAMLAFDAVFNLCGRLLWKRGGKWDPERWEEVKGADLTKRWKEWEWSVRKVMNDQERGAEVRAAAESALENMKAVRLAMRKVEEDELAVR